MPVSWWVFEINFSLAVLGTCVKRYCAAATQNTRSDRLALPIAVRSLWVSACAFASLRTPACPVKLFWTADAPVLLHQAPSWCCKAPIDPPSVQWKVRRRVCVVLHERSCHTFFFCTLKVLKNVYFIIMYSIAFYLACIIICFIIYMIKNLFISFLLFSILFYILLFYLSVWNLPRLQGIFIQFVFI